MKRIISIDSWLSITLQRTASDFDYRTKDYWELFTFFFDQYLQFFIFIHIKKIIEPYHLIQNALKFVVNCEYGLDGDGAMKKLPTSPFEENENNGIRNRMHLIIMELKKPWEYSPLTIITTLQWLSSCTRTMSKSQFTQEHIDWDV